LLRLIFSGRERTSFRLLRFALRCFNAFATEATRTWLRGERSREETETLIATAFRNLLLHTIPALPG